MAQYELAYEDQQFLPHTDIQVNILAGTAWVAVGREDYILYEGDQMMVGKGRHFAVIAGLSQDAMVYEVTTSPAMPAPNANTAKKPSSILLEAIAYDSTFEADWLWFAERITVEAERRYCLQRAYYINPHNQQTVQELSKLLKVSGKVPVQQPQRWFSRVPRKSEI